MIKTIQFKDGENAFSRFWWRREADFFQRRFVTFQEGINIVVGPTGSGKSTLLDMLASYMAAKQGGASEVTETWLRDNVSRKAIRDVFELRHDGQPILYSNPRDTVGVSGNNLDEDFYLNGLINLRDTGSTGQQSITKTSRCMGAILAAISDYKPDSDTYGSVFPDTISYRVKHEDVNEVWGSYLDIAEAMLSPNIEKGQKTIILDEPDAGLSLAYQHGFWTSLIEKAKQSGYQIIIASHSIFALNVKDVHYIETVPRYVEDCNTLIKGYYAAK